MMSRTFKPVYRQSRRFDRTCRCNGACAYCRGNRLHAVRVAEQAAEDDRQLWQRGERRIAIEQYEYRRDADDYEALLEADARKWKGRG